jgi:mRNA interferase MazF
VLVRYPFSDLSRSKLRPAAALATVDRGDLVLCQITSNPYADPRAIELTQESYATGSLPRISYVRPGKLFTGSQDLIAATAGQLKAPVHTQLVNAVVELLKGDGR